MKRFIPIVAIILCLTFVMVGCGEEEVENYWYPAHEAIVDSMREHEQVYSAQTDIVYGHVDFETAVCDTTSEFNQLKKYYESFLDCATFGLATYEQVLATVPLGEEVGEIMQYENDFKTLKTDVSKFSNEINKLFVVKKQTEEFFASAQTFDSEKAIEREKLRQMKVAFESTFDTAIKLNKSFMTVYRKAYCDIFVDAEHIVLDVANLQSLIPLSLELQNNLLNDVGSLYFDKDGIFENNNGEETIDDMFESLKSACVKIDVSTMKTKIAPEGAVDLTLYVSNGAYVNAVKNYITARGAYINQRKTVESLINDKDFEWQDDLSKIKDETKRAQLEEQRNNLFEYMKNSTILVGRFNAILDLFV